MLFPRLLLSLLSLRPDTISLNRNLDYARPLWKAEASKEFKNPVIVLVHGGGRGGRWFSFPDRFPPIPADLLTAGLKLVYPDRPLVFCSCNADGFDLNVPNVYYTKRLLWCRPGWDSRMYNWHLERGTGSIYGFMAR